MWHVLKRHLVAKITACVGSQVAINASLRIWRACKARVYGGSDKDGTLLVMELINSLYTVLGSPDLSGIPSPARERLDPAVITAKMVAAAKSAGIHVPGGRFDRKSTTSTGTCDACVVSTHSILLLRSLPFLRSLRYHKTCILKFFEIYTGTNARRQGATACRRLRSD
jgi:hypothetical protein